MSAESVFNRSKQTAILGLVVLVSASVFSQSANAQASIDPNEISLGHVVNVHYNEYQVTGDSEDEILQSLLENGPEKDGGRYFGLTASEVSLRYKLNPVRGSCNLIHVGVKTNITISLPKHRSVRRLNSDLRREWYAFEKALKNHEQGHVSASQETSRQIFNALSSMRQESCAGLEERIRATVNQIMAEGEQFHDTYDRDSRHGANDGATWPRY